MPTINKAPKRNTYVKHTDSSKAYNCPQWKHLRASYIMKHPLCEMCLEEGKIKPVEEVHHKIPISTGIDELQMKDLLLDENNLIGLCEEHHHLIHNKIRKDGLI